MDLKKACLTIRLYGQARTDPTNPIFSHNSEVGRLIQLEKINELFTKKEWIECLKLAIYNESEITDQALFIIEKKFPKIIGELVVEYRSKKGI